MMGSLVVCKANIWNKKDLAAGQVSANREKKSPKGNNNVSMIINPSSELFIYVKINVLSTNIVGLSGSMCIR
jgi:hypothetical protein